MTTAERLRALLDRKGFTISAAAELAGMGRQQLWRIVTGKVANPTGDTIRKIVEAVGGTMAEFYAEEET